MKEIVSIIITILNGAKWIDECFDSIRKQELDLVNKESNISIEVCVFNDCSTDLTLEYLKNWRAKLLDVNISLKIFENQCGRSLGVGYGRNRAIEKCYGNYICFQDIDDVMLPKRIALQLNLAQKHKNAIIGSQFIRLPENSTSRFTKWANHLPKDKLNVEIFTSNGPTIIMPTWFCHKNVFEKVGGFCETGTGTPEDLIFFYKHLDLGGEIYRIDEPLLFYRYHSDATTFTIKEQTIWKFRLMHLIENILKKQPWQNGFTIWNAGKQGRKFYRDLPDYLQDKVLSFCDVDTKKLNKNYNHYDCEKHKIIRKIPIIHFSKAKSPFIICMKLDLTDGAFEMNLNSLNLIEGIDYILFS